MKNEFKHVNHYIALAQCKGETCAENAECLNYQCVCKLGYYGKGTERCERMYNVYAYCVMFINRIKKVKQRNTNIYI